MTGPPPLGRSGARGTHRGSSAPQREAAPASAPGRTAEPIRFGMGERWIHRFSGEAGISVATTAAANGAQGTWGDRKSTRLNSSHVASSYGGCSLQKKT